VEVAEAKGVAAEGRKFILEGDGAGAVVGDGDFDGQGTRIDLLNGHVDVLHGLPDLRVKVPFALSADLAIGALIGDGDEIHGPLALQGDVLLAPGVRDEALVSSTVEIKMTGQLGRVEGSLASGKMCSRCTRNDRGGERWGREDGGGGSKKADKAKGQDGSAKGRHLE
jgi:hypothetical protein